MTTTAKSLEGYIERIVAHLLKRYPGIHFEVEHWDDNETFVYCYPAEPTEDTYDITVRAGNIVTDALVDAGYRIYVMTPN